MEWGRIAPDGSVFVRTRDGGERQIGSWQAGSVDEGLRYYRRRYDDLAAEVGILEARVLSPTADVKAVATAASKMQASLDEASVIGDLAALHARLDTVLAKVAARQEEMAKARAEAAAAAADRKRALVTRAQELAAGSDWRATGDRFRALVEEWKTVRGVDRKTDAELWEQFSAARKDFERRRRAHFAELDKQRESAAEEKRRLVGEAEKLAGSEEWGPTARRFKELMARWRAAGRAGREQDEELWARFKAAQDAFFARRGEVFSARDAEYAGNLAAKESLLAEAEALDPHSDLDGARKRLRTIHEKWEKVGKVPRESMAALEERLAAVERTVREAGATARHVVATESPLVIRLRESVTKLESRLARATAAGDTKLADDTTQALQTQREWLAQAERADT